MEFRGNERRRSDSVRLVGLRAGMGESNLYHEIPIWRKMMIMRNELH